MLDGAAVSTRALPLLLLALACENEPTAARREPSPAPAPAKIEIVKAPPGREATEIIRAETERAAREKKQLVVYVGAPWCEPCVRFHDAAAEGKLDQAFPGVVLLEFDRDKDEVELGKAGCLSRLIPLFARPTPGGRCSERRIEGSIKGQGAVAEITPRLRGILE